MKSKDEILKARLSRIEILLNEVDQSVIPSAVSEGVRHAIELTLTDKFADTALWRVRKVLESIISDLYRLEYGRGPRTQTLDSKIQRLDKDDKLSDRVKVSAHHIRELGNFGTHGETKDATRDDVASSLDELMLVVKWYCEWRVSAFADKSRSAQGITKPGPRDYILDTQQPSKSTAIEILQQAPVLVDAHNLVAVRESEPPPRRRESNDLGRNGVEQERLALEIAERGKQAGDELHGPEPVARAGSDQVERPANPIFDDSREDAARSFAFRAFEDIPPQNPIPLEPPKADKPAKAAEIESLYSAQHVQSSRSAISGVLRPETLIHSGITFVRIEPGEFRIGEPQKKRSYHVDKPFWISKTPITWREWREFDKNRVPRTGTGLPVVNISRELAEAYCASIGGELPTEEEWESAAMGRPDSGRYPWGNEPDADMANCASSGPRTCGSYPPNAFGLVDMIGNVWEWCAGAFDSRFKLGVVRGGSWRERLEDIAVWSRQSRDPSQPPGNDTGFRCILRSTPRG